MILDTRTIALLFVDGLSAGLVLLLAWIAARARLGRRPAAELEDLGSLLALSLCALFALRIVAWAGFFLVLDGCVPSLAENGVMCAFGVVQLRPELAHFALWAKPAAVGALISWWAVAAAERDAEDAQFQRLRFALVLPVAVLVGLEIAGEARWIFADKLAEVVTCCRSALDPLRAGSASKGVLGLSGSALLAADFAGKLALIVACAGVAKKSLAPRLGWTLALCAFGCAIAFLDLATWREGVAPRALGLEFHRCAYELVTRSLVLGPVALLAALGHLALLSLPLLALLHAREPEGTRRTTTWLAQAAALTFATELVAIAVHIL
ncbi:MAG TPA: hypothetical protein VM509_16200 [Planctomycetota bacterium]|nr:hypothetical protein [Planctomycetota bacterium]